MKRIGMGLVGAGFVGPHHVDAVRRLGFVDVVALAEATLEIATERARALGVPKAYGDYRALIDDPDVDVVHNATPNALHYPINAATIDKGKHIVSDKPLAVSAKEARILRDAAAKAGVVNAVTFSYRGNPLVQHARHKVSSGEIGEPRFFHGHYLQDWLSNDVDYSWRLDETQTGISSAVADIGSHWCDLAEHVSGQRISHVLGHIGTALPKRRVPRVTRQAFDAGSDADAFDWTDIALEDMASVLLRFANGAIGSFTVAQVTPGHKNDCMLEISGSLSSVRWAQEDQNYLWIGHRERPNEVLMKDPRLIAPDVRRYARLPGGLQEGWADAFSNIMSDIYSYIGSDQPLTDAHPPAFATFDDGYRACIIVETIIESARSGAWARVPQ